MSQAKLTSDGVATDAGEWFDAHASDYTAVIERLARVRSVVLTGDLEHAAENLKHGYVNAVMSIKTEKDRHERAFTAWTSGDKSLDDAMSMTVYGNQKADWVARTMDKVDWVEVAMAVRAHVRNGRTTDLLAMSNALVGVSHAKWSFTLAMCGVWEVACVDSNVARRIGADAKAVSNLKSAEEYTEYISVIANAVPQNVPPFVAQWALYDMERGEHARHMAFFREVHMA